MISVPGYLLCLGLQTDITCYETIGTRVAGQLLITRVGTYPVPGYGPSHSRFREKGIVLGIPTRVGIAPLVRHRNSYQ